MKPQKYDIVIADTSCLILLQKINCLHLLELLFDNISVTSVVADEFGEKLPNFIKIMNNSNDKAVEILKISVDIGEASSIALALDISNPLIIMDDLKGRKLCDKLGINYIGTISILLKAVKDNIITDPVKLVHDIKSTNFRISNSILSLFANPENK